MLSKQGTGSTGQSLIMDTGRASTVSLCEPSRSVQILTDRMTHNFLYLIQIEEFSVQSKQMILEIAVSCPYNSNWYTAIFPKKYVSNRVVQMFNLLK